MGSLPTTSTGSVEPTCAKQALAQPITEAQTTVGRVLLIDKMQVVGAVRRGRQCESVVLYARGNW